VLHSWVGSWPNWLTLDQAGKLARDKHSSLLRKYVNYREKKFYNIGRWKVLHSRVGYWPYSQTLD
jgi:hypothetical protein